MTITQHPNRSSPPDNLDGKLPADIAKISNLPHEHIIGLGAGKVKP